MDILMEANPKPPTSHSRAQHQQFAHQAEPPGSGPVQDHVELNPVLDENWEDEADKLYEWTQELSYDEIVATPRLQTSQTQYGVTY